MESDGLDVFWNIYLVYLVAFYYSIVTSRNRVYFSTRRGLLFKMVSVIGMTMA